MSRQGKEERAPRDPLFWRLVLYLVGLPVAAVPALLLAHWWVGPCAVQAVPNVPFLVAYVSCAGPLLAAHAWLARQGRGLWIEHAIVLPVAGFFIATSLNGLILPINRGRAKRTASDLRAMETALFSHREQLGAHPGAEDIDELAGALEPTFIQRAPRVDGWHNPLLVRSGSRGWTIVSPGCDGTPSHEDPWAYEGSCVGQSYADDLVLRGDPKAHWIQAPLQSGWDEELPPCEPERAP